MLLENFIQTIKSKERSENTLELLKHTVTLCENWIKKPLEDATYDEIVQFIEHVKSKGMVLDGINRSETLSKGSIWTIENKLIQFYAYCFDETDDPKYHKMVKKLKSIKIGKPKNSIRPQDILFPEDAKKLINVATLERDRCIIASFYEGGLRIGEFLALDVDMVQMDEAKHEVTFHIPDVEGCKTGARSVLCTDIYGYVEDWLKCNPSKKFMPLSEAGISKIVKKLYKKAGINKPSHIHMMRHSSITNACIMKLQPNQISMRYWGIPNSAMLETYLHLSEQIVNSGYRDAKGLGNGNSIVINSLAVRCVSCGKLIQSGELCQVCKDNKELKEKILIQNNQHESELEAIKESFENQQDIMSEQYQNLQDAQSREIIMEQKIEEMQKQIKILISTVTSIKK